jgi:NitT/TauT family transport system substrate-binding protein
MKRYLLILLFLIALLTVVIIWQESISDDPDVINVGYLPCDHEAAIFVAQAQNIYQKQGLKVKITQFTTGSDIITALASGKLDVGYVGITPTLQGISQGVPIKVVGAVNLEGSGIVVQPNSTIKTPADLKGQKIATPGVSSIQQVLLLYELQKYNLNSSDLDIVSLNIYMIPQSLAAQKVDGYIAYEPFVSIARYQNVGKVLLYSGEIIDRHPCCVVVAREEFIQQHPQELDKFLKIHQNATDYVNNNPNQSAVMISQVIITNPEVEKLALPNVIFVSRVDQAFQENVLRFVQIENELGYLKKNLTAQDIFDPQFLGS